jgi:hypothetical protein
MSFSKKKKKALMLALPSSLSLIIPTLYRYRQGELKDPEHLGYFKKNVDPGVHSSWLQTPA